mgnify:FL=1
MPGGTVGEFNAVERLGAVRRSLYEDISKVLVPPSVGLQEAENTNAYVGLEPEQYLHLVRRMLRIGMVRLRRRVKVVNGIFGVWKKKPKRRGGRAATGEAGPNLSLIHI